MTLQNQVLDISYFLNLHAQIAGLDGFELNEHFFSLIISFRFYYIDRQNMMPNEHTKRTKLIFQE